MNNRDVQFYYAKETQLFVLWLICGYAPLIHMADYLINDSEGQALPVFLDFFNKDSHASVESLKEVFFALGEEHQQNANYQKICQSLLSEEYMGFLDADTVLLFLRALRKIQFSTTELPIDIFLRKPKNQLMQLALLQGSIIANFLPGAIEEFASQVSTALLMHYILTNNKTIAYSARQHQLLKQCILQTLTNNALDPYLTQHFILFFYHQVFSLVYHGQSIPYPPLLKMIKDIEKNSDQVTGHDGIVRAAYRKESFTQSIYLVAMNYDETKLYLGLSYLFRIPFGLQTMARMLLKMGSEKKQLKRISYDFLVFFLLRISPCMLVLTFGLNYFFKCPVNSFVLIFLNVILATITIHFIIQFHPYYNRNIQLFVDYVLAFDVNKSLEELEDYLRLIDIYIEQKEKIVPTKKEAVAISLSKIPDYQISYSQKFINSIVAKELKAKPQSNNERPVFTQVPNQGEIETLTWIINRKQYSNKEMQNTVLGYPIYASSFISSKKGPVFYGAIDATIIDQPELRKFSELLKNGICFCSPKGKQGVVAHKMYDSKTGYFKIKALGAEGDNRLWNDGKLYSAKNDSERKLIVFNALRSHNESGRFQSALA